MSAHYISQESGLNPPFRFAVIDNKTGKYVAFYMTERAAVAAEDQLNEKGFLEVYE